MQKHLLESLSKEAHSKEKLGSFLANNKLQDAGKFSHCFGISGSFDTTAESNELENIYTNSKMVMINFLLSSIAEPNEVSTYGPVISVAKRFQVIEVNGEPKRILWAPATLVLS